MPEKHQHAPSMQKNKIRWINEEAFGGYGAEAGPFDFQIRRQLRSDPDHQWRLYVYDRQDPSLRLWEFRFPQIGSARKKARDVLRRPDDFLSGDWHYQQTKARQAREAEESGRLELMAKTVERIATGPFVPAEGSEGA